MTDTPLPFRWDLSRREQLGRLVRPRPKESEPGLLDELRRCSARLLALAGDSELVFVGRSPESIFDYLSGALVPTSWRDRLVLFNLSVRDWTPKDVATLLPRGLVAFREHLRHAGLAPADVAASPRPVALVDLVWAGVTFGHLQQMMLDWAREQKVDPAAVRRRLRFIGITERTKNSPNTWRWYQRVAWASDYPRSALKSVSIPWWLWDYLGNRQAKVAHSNPPMYWGAEWMAEPPRYSENLEALRLAVRLYDRGARRDERQALAAALAAQPEMRHPWLRRLVLELRGG